MKGAVGCYLWVIDSRGIPYILERTTDARLAAERPIKHPNLTGAGPASCGGELWFVNEARLFVNGCSGRYEPRGRTELESAVSLFRSLVLGQVKTEEKSNEITAIPKLLELLHLHGCIVTIDAMGCQREIVERIVEKGADYVISLNGNQGTLQQEMEALFTEARDESFETVPHGELRSRSVPMSDVRLY